MSPAPTSTAVCAIGGGAGVGLGYCATGGGWVGVTGSEWPHPMVVRTPAAISAAPIRAAVCIGTRPLLVQPCASFFARQNVTVVYSSDTTPSINYDASVSRRSFRGGASVGG